VESDYTYGTVIVFVDVLSSSSESVSKLSDDDSELSLSDGNKRQDQFQETPM